MATHSLKPRLLFVDAYDSFAQNIVVLFRDALDAEVTFTTIDDKTFGNLRDEEFTRYLRQWDGVIVGPGPGNPINPVDVGWSTRLWSLSEQDIVPVLGICLGFQSLCLSFGAQIRRLKEPKHGIIGSILVKGGSILTDKEVDDAYKVTHYHSLTIQAEGNPSCPWSLLQDCPELTALAWDFTDEINGPILQAVRHRSRPFWGVQYHPESICSENGPLLARNWWEEVSKWRDVAGRSTAHRTRKLAHPSSLSVPIPPCNHSTLTSKLLDFIRYSGVGELGGEVTYSSLTSRRLTVQTICRALNLMESEVVILESGTSRDGTPLHPRTGRTSIIGIVDEQSSRLEYSCSARKMTILHLKSKHELSLETSDPWPLLKLWQEHSRGLDGPVDSPFWGGLMGFVSYEAGLQTSLGLGLEQLPIHHVAEGCEQTRPDIAFVHIRKSIVIDHAQGTVYAQILRRSHDPAWLEATTRILTNLAETYEEENKINNDGEVSLHQESKESDAFVHQTTVSRPSKQRYWNNLQSCDEEIRAGNSYELCLTDQSRVLTRISGSSNEFAWPLYRGLVDRNAAPFSAFLRLQTREQGVTIVSSSPERFLSWNRAGLCEYRPIKGTVKKGPDITLKKATQILSTSKEIAENLMIADLIRHDLNSVPGIKDVRVPELFKVEEYATVYQLVSVIQGDLPQPSSSVNGVAGGLAHGDKQVDQGAPNGTDIVPERHKSTGIDVLRRSLPPGSMTGAPKLRSCQILQGLEQNPRGIYSGVLGYLDCGGGGDFSVIIRTAYSWDDEDKADCEGIVNKSWHVGAGGAVTAQSTLQGEWDEMLAKADTILSAFV